MKTRFVTETEGNSEWSIESDHGHFRLKFSDESYLSGKAKALGQITLSYQLRLK